MNRNKVTNEERARVLFNEFCIWRSRVNTGYRHVACDENSNRIARELLGMGYFVIYSTTPKADGYYYGLSRSQDEVVEIDQIILTDIDLGHDLSDDPEHSDEWEKNG